MFDIYLMLCVSLMDIIDGHQQQEHCSQFLKCADKLLRELVSSPSIIPYVINSELRP